MSIMGKTFASLVVLILLVSYAVWAKLSSPFGEQKVTYIPSIKECFHAGSATPWKYCIHRPANGVANGNLAYLFHGRNLDENIWNDDTFYTAMIQSYWQRAQVSPPTIVSVSFGPIWLLTEKGKAEKSGLLDTFVNDVMPEIEKRTGVPKARLLFGESMGGLNSLTVALKRPSLFQKVASLCPTIYVGSPFTDLNDVKSFLKRTGADPKAVYGLIRLAKDYFRDEEEWQKASPLKLVEQVDPKTAPSIYLSCGLYDVYGNFEGNERFSEIAQRRGLRIIWRQIYGGHCATDISSLAEFLAQ